MNRAYQVRDSSSRYSWRQRDRHFCAREHFRVCRWRTHSAAPQRLSVKAPISRLLIARPIFTAMPHTDDEDVPTFIDGINDDVRLDRMNAHGRRDHPTLAGSFWVLRQELECSL
jgi:hypothetical protein